MTKARLHRINLKVHLEEKQVIESNARNLGLDVSAYIRWVTMRGREIALTQEQRQAIALECSRFIMERLKP